MRFSVLSMLFIAAMPLATSHAAGVQIGRTRVIFDANKKEVALPLINKEDELPWLVQSWIDTGDGKTRGPFIITPPLFRLDAQKEQNLRISWTGGALPGDRESLFYLNVRTIPGESKDDGDKNVLRLIYKTRLKFFWRPKGLSGTPGENCQKLRFTRQGNRLNIINDGSYYSVFDTLNVGGVKISDIDYVAPKNSLALTLKQAPAGNDVHWRCITDYGNAGKEFTTPLNKS